MRIFCFPLLLLQFEFYAFSIDEISGWVWLRAWFWAVKFLLRFGFFFLFFSIFFFLSSSSPFSFFNFGLIIYMNLYMGLMNLDLDLERFWWFCGVSVMILSWVSWWVLIDFVLGFPVGLSWFWIGFSNCFSINFGLIFCARLRCLVVVLGLVVGWLYSAALSCCRH